MGSLDWLFLKFNLCCTQILGEHQTIVQELAASAFGSKSRSAFAVWNKYCGIRNNPLCQAGVSLFWAWRRGHLRRQVTPPRMVIITHVSTLKKKPEPKLAEEGDPLEEGFISGRQQPERSLFSWPSGEKRKKEQFCSRLSPSKYGF